MKPSTKIETSILFEKARSLIAYLEATLEEVKAESMALAQRDHRGTHIHCSSTSTHTQTSFSFKNPQLSQIQKPTKLSSRL